MPTPLSRHPGPLVLGILALAVLADGLLRVEPWGLNAAIWFAALTLTAWFALPRDRPHSRAGMGRWLVVAAAFAALLALRDSQFLRAWNLIAVLAALTVAALRSSGADLVQSRVGRFVSGAAHTARNVAGGAVPLLVGELRWPDGTAAASRRRYGAWALGLVLTVPALVVFGGLFAAADPVFERLTTGLFTVDIETIGSHVLFAALFGWLSAGYFRSLLQPVPAADAGSAIAGRARFATIGLPVAAVTVLFALFVTIQATYLFGGADWVRQASGLGYADYARRGFFELVTAAALVVPMLLGGRWLLADDDAAGLARFRALALALVVLVALVAASAIWRMRLYTGAFGLTEDRFYATAFILWVVGVLGWFAYTALRDAHGFAFGTVVSGLGLLAVLNAMNPDGIIARVNLDRVHAGHEVDVDYLRSLSSDAIPPIVARWAALSEAQRDVMRSSIVERVLRPPQPGDWRTWNLSRQRARTALARASVTAERPLPDGGPPGG